MTLDRTPRSPAQADAIFAQLAALCGRELVVHTSLVVLDGRTGAGDRSLPVWKRIVRKNFSHARTILSAHQPETISAYFAGSGSGGERADPGVPPESYALGFVVGHPRGGR